MGFVSYPGIPLISRYPTHFPFRLISHIHLYFSEHVLFYSGFMVNILYSTKYTM